MRILHCSAVLVASSILFGPVIADAAGQDVGAQQPAHLETQVAVSMDYLLYLPKDYAMKESWPLLLFLHGSGERGDNLDLVTIHGPPKLIKEGQDFPFIVVSPQCPKGQRWQSVTLSALLDEIAQLHRDVTKTKALLERGGTSRAKVRRSTLGEGSDCCPS